MSRMGLLYVINVTLKEWDEKKIKHLYEEKYNNGSSEGYVVRLFESFNYGQFRDSVAKYVRKEFGDKLKEGSAHWRHKKIIKNKLIKND